MFLSIMPFLRGCEGLYSCSDSVSVGFPLPIAGCEFLPDFVFYPVLAFLANLVILYFSGRSLEKRLEICPEWPLSVKVLFIISCIMWGIVLISLFLFWLGSFFDAIIFSTLGYGLMLPIFIFNKIHPDLLRIIFTMVWLWVILEIFDHLYNKLNDKAGAHKE